MPECQNFLSEEQTAFIKGRHIVDNVMAMMLADAYDDQNDRQEVKKEGMILALDQEKAYDRVRWDWLFGVLKFIEVPDGMIAARKATVFRLWFHQPTVGYFSGCRSLLTKFPVELITKQSMSRLRYGFAQQ